MYLGRGLSGGPAAEYKLTGLKAARFFLDCIQKDGNLPAGLDDKRRCDCAKVLSAYKAMMTPEEARLLAIESSMAVVAPMINNITSQLVARIKEQYVSSSKKVPKRLGKGDILVNTLIDNIRESKLIVDSQAFAVWRTRGSQGSSSQDVGQGKRKRGSQGGGGGGGDSSDTEEEEALEEGAPEEGAPEEEAPEEEAPSTPRKSPRVLGQPGREAAAEEEAEAEGSSPSRGSDDDYSGDEAMPLEALAGLGSPGQPYTFD